MVRRKTKTPRVKLYRCTSKRDAFNLYVEDAVGDSQYRSDEQIALSGSGRLGKWIKRHGKLSLSGSISGLRPGQLGSSRHHARHDLTTMPAVNAEIAVSRQQDRIGEDFGHPQKTGVRKTHRNVGVFFQKSNDLIQMFIKLEP